MALIPRTHAQRHRRSGGVMFLVVMLILGALLIIGNMLINRSKEESRDYMREAMRDPKTCLERFFTERWKEQSPSQDDWKRLMDFMSRDDLDWLEANRQCLADLAARHYGDSPATSEERQRFDALHLLLGFGNEAERPLVSSIQVSGDHAIAYVHPRGRIDKLKEIALVDEDGFWKIRRFLGERDSREVMDAIVTQKHMQSEPLTEDEQSYLDDPAGYQGRIRARLLAEAGLKP